MVSQHASLPLWKAGVTQANKYLFLNACRTHLLDDAELFAEHVCSLVEIGSAAFCIGELLLRL
jgi:hypothetical protein